MKLDLLTNAKVVNDAMKFVLGYSIINKKLTSKEENSSEQSKEDFQPLSRGMLDTKLVLNCSSCSRLCVKPSRPCVSIIPGRMELTRILRYFSSTVHMRASDLYGGFGCVVNTDASIPLDTALNPDRNEKGVYSTYTL